MQGANKRHPSQIMTTIHFFSQRIHNHSTGFFFACIKKKVEVNAFFDSSTFQQFWNWHFFIATEPQNQPMAPTVAVKILEAAGNEAAGYWGMSSSIYAKDWGDGW